MEERRKHFVLVHGACHGGWCWYKVATRLKSAGHKVTAVELAASGVHHKQVNDLRSFSDYNEPLMEFLTTISQEERVVLVGHSLGGLSLTAAMERLPEKVAVAVFLTAFMPGPNFSYVALREEFERQFKVYMDTKFTYNNGPNNRPTSLLLGPNCLASQVYQLSPPEDLTLATSLVRHSPLFDTGAVQNEIILTKEKYGSVPRVFIVCDQDLMITEDMQRWMIKNNPPDDVINLCGCDHMPMFSKPQQLCSCLQEIANAYL